MSLSERGSRRDRPTIDDVARLAGVSKGAVSRAMGGGQGISAATVERVRATAESLGWRPSVSARALAGARSQALGLVIRRPARLISEDPFFPNFVAGMEDVLSGHGYAVVLCVVTAGTEEATYRRLVAEHRVDGFLIGDLHHPEPRYGLLTELGVPVVAFGWPGRACPFPAVGVDDRAGARAVVEHLIALGHRRVGHVAGLPTYIHTRARRAAWQETLRRHGLSPGPEAVGEFTAAGGVKATHQLLDSAEPPTAIFYANDLMAVAGISAAADRGLRVPDHIAIAGFDDLTLGAHLSPSLTTVGYDIHEWATQATATLLRLIDGDTVPQRTLIDSGLVIRRSTLGVAGVRSVAAHRTVTKHKTPARRARKHADGPVRNAAARRGDASVG